MNRPCLTSAGPMTVRPSTYQPINGGMRPAEPGVERAETVHGLPVIDSPVKQKLRGPSPRSAEVVHPGIASPAVDIPTWQCKEALANVKTEYARIGTPPENGSPEADLDSSGHSEEYEPALELIEIRGVGHLDGDGGAHGEAKP